MVDEKIRIRTKEELDLREKYFLEIVDIFERNNIPFFLQAGVVLGAHRENYFIKWDWDVEFGMFSNDFILNYELIRSKLVENKFEIFHEIKSPKDGKIDCFKGIDEKSTLFEILSWSLDKNKNSYRRWKINIPREFLEKDHKIKFLNKYFKCPGPVEEYLTYQYKDWKVPKISSNKNEYLSDNFLEKDLFVKKFIFKILKKLFNK